MIVEIEMAMIDFLIRAEVGVGFINALSDPQEICLNYRFFFAHYKVISFEIHDKFEIRDRREIP